MSVERKTFVIERLPEGGYCVAELGRPDQRPVFASLDLEDALGFLMDQFEPEEEYSDEVLP